MLEVTGQDWGLRKLSESMVISRGLMEGFVAAGGEP